MNRIICVSILFLSFQTVSFSQMWNGIDTLYGNEWINYDQEYFKIKVAADGIYRVNKAALESSGVPINNVAGGQFRLYHMGEEVPVFTTNNGNFTTEDYIEFYGKKNRSELDKHVFYFPEEDLLNPRYSLYNDTSAYFLTWNAENSDTRYEEVVNELVDLPAKETAYTEELELVLNAQYQKEYGSQTIRNSYFDTAEGFGSTNLQSQSFTLTPTHADLNGGTGNLHVRYATDYGGGNTAGAGVHDQHISINGVEVANDQTSRFRVLTHDFSIANGDLANAIEIDFEGLTGAQDKQSVANLILTYPRLFNFENGTYKYFKIAASNEVRYLEIDNFNTSDVLALYDLTNQIKLTPEEENGILKIALPPSATDRELVLINELATKQVTNLDKANFIDYLELDTDYLIISHKDLMVPDGNGLNQVEEYANYRSSAQGGGYSTSIVDIEDLYDQFGYGVVNHPICIRNFGHFLDKNEELPDYFLLIGKSREYFAYRTTAQVNNTTNLKQYVPTFGYPGADNLLLSTNNSATPLAAIGRIAATNSEEIRIYLDKVKEFDDFEDVPSTIEDRAWMKRIIHLGGGGNANEQASIKSNLIAMQNEIEGNDFGGKVFPFYKTSTDPIQVSINEQVFSLINTGVSMITFFGHSGTNNFDFNIDNPANFLNEGKYPLMFSLGCNIGNIHTGGFGVAERFNFTEDKVTVAFCASSSLGQISDLRNYMVEVYNLVGGDMYGSTLGQILREATRKADFQSGGTNKLAQQFILHGDPALRINPAPSVDYLIDEKTVQFVPENINTQLDSFDIQFDVVNIGRVAQDSFFIEIRQQFPDGNDQIVVTQKVAPPAFRENMTFRIPTFGRSSVGLNRIYVTVDSENEIEELPFPGGESNNELVDDTGATGVGLFINDNSVLPVYPPNYSIVNQSTLTLKATTSNSLVAERKYLMEIDISKDFDTPNKMTTEVTQGGGMIEWNPNYNWEDERVYYWRVSPDSISPVDGYKWTTSSFVFKEDVPTGWNQSHHQQYEDNSFVNMEIGANEEIGFVPNLKDFYFKNGVNSVGLINILINNEYYGKYWGFPNGGVYVMWIDSVNVQPYVNYPPTEGPYQYSIHHPSNWWIKTFNFNTSHYDDEHGGRKDLMEFLENAVQDGEHVVFFTVQKNELSSYEPEEWEADTDLYGKNIFDILEAEGATMIRSTATNGATPYTFAYQKGSGPVHSEQLAPTLQDVLITEFAIEGNWDRGETISTPIGPAKSWDKLVWNADITPETDTVSVDVLAVFEEDEFKDSVLVSNLPMGETDLSFINTADFPRIKLRFNSEDSLLRTSAPLDYWRVYYQGVPEFLPNPNKEYAFVGDTLEQGELLSLDVAVENASDYEGDSVLVKYAIRNSSNEEEVFYKKFAELPEQTSLIADFQFDTREALGEYALSMQINPDEDQNELTGVNNYLNTQFFVEGDKRNPIIDVTFDGVHILHGDLVASKPDIRVTLEDDNKYLALDDTSAFRLFLQYPNQVEPVRVYMDGETLQFYPAEEANLDKKNKAHLEFRPEFTEDGLHHLLVQAQDASGNSSGDYDYKIGFEIITKTSISNLLNYPNPFSTSTCFVYTLTGNEAPDEFKIQIMTVSGRIVKEITQDEMGPLKVGTHKTDYAWDGRDEFGDQLANGIYLYRVVARKDGELIENYQTGADAYFQKGFGKMVLIR